MISREKIFRYVKKKYDVEPDYPLPVAYNYIAHEDKAAKEIPAGSIHLRPAKRRVCHLRRHSLKIWA